MELYKHQLAAIEKLHTGAVLAGGVGSGKSLTALGYYYSKVCDGKSPILGHKDFSFMKIEKPLYIITTARKRSSLDWNRESSNFNISLVVDSWNNIKKYTQIKNAFFIFDEQRLVGNGVWVKSFYKIAKNNDWILLTATPADTWLDYIPVMVANGFYKNRTEFIRRHVVFNNFSKFPKVERYIEVKRLIKNRDSILINMHFVRKTIRNDIIVSVNYDKEKTRKLFVDRWNIFENKPIKDISELCFLLRKVSNMDSSRLTKLKEIFDEHKKIIVFYNFNYELDILREFAENNGIPYSEWNGHRHQELLKDSPIWLYFCQYVSASEAWNAIETDTIIFYSQTYSYKVLEQASGRIDRLNTPFENLWYYHFVSNSQIDQAIRESLFKKKTFNENRFQGYYF